jgi:hypothetical protein
VESRRLSPAFKLAVYILLGLTIVLGGLAVGASFAVADPTASQSSAESWLFGAASSTLSALFGLLAGKVV